MSAVIVPSKDKDCYELSMSLVDTEDMWAFAQVADYINRQLPWERIRMRFPYCMPLRDDCRPNDQHTWALSTFALLLNSINAHLEVTFYDPHCNVKALAVLLKPKLHVDIATDDRKPLYPPPASVRAKGTFALFLDNNKGGYPPRLGITIQEGSQFVGVRLGDPHPAPDIEVVTFADIWQSHIHQLMEKLLTESNVEKVLIVLPDGRGKEDCEKIRDSFALKEKVHIFQGTKKRDINGKIILFSLGNIAEVAGDSAVGVIVADDLLSTGETLAFVTQTISTLACRGKLLCKGTTYVCITHKDRKWKLGDKCLLGAACAKELYLTNSTTELYLTNSTLECRASERLRIVLADKRPDSFAENTGVMSEEPQPGVSFKKLCGHIHKKIKSHKDQATADAFVEQFVLFCEATQKERPAGSQNAATLSMFVCAFTSKGSSSFDCLAGELELFRAAFPHVIHARKMFELFTEKRV
jgi:hypothetical protein